MVADFFLGESLVGDGNEVAHIDLIIGSKSGHAGQAFVNTLANNTDGFTKLLAVVTPNLPAKPDALLFNKVTIKGATQAVQMFGPAQAAVARAVVDSVSSGVIPRDKVDDYCILVGVFIHWQAKNDKKIFDFNYRAVKESIERALRANRASTPSSAARRPPPTRSRAARTRADAPAVVGSCGRGAVALPPLDRFLPVRDLGARTRCASFCCSSTAHGCRACSTGWWRTTAPPTKS